MKNKKFIIVLSLLFLISSTIFLNFLNNIDFRFLIENRTNVYYWEEQKPIKEDENIENLAYCENKKNEGGLECGFYFNGKKIKIGDSNE